MEYTENYYLNLPSGSDKAMPDAFNENFRYIDDALKLREPEQTYDPTSSKPQSGNAVAQATANVKSVVEKSVEEISNIFDKSINLYNKNTNAIGFKVDTTVGSTTLGELISDASKSTSDFIYLEAGNYYITGFSDLANGTAQQIQYIARYDVDKNYETRINFYTGLHKVTKSCYVRLGGNTSAMKYIVFSKDVEPTEYIEYKNKIKSEYLPTTDTFDKKINAFKEYIEISQNVFNKESIIEDGYYNAKGNYDNTSSAAKGAKTISVKNVRYEKITVSHMYNYHTFWDADGNFIDGLYNKTMGVYTITNIPENTDIIKITINATTDIAKIMVVEGDALPENYVPYGYYDPYNLDMPSESQVMNLNNKKIMFFGDSITDPTYTKYVNNLISYSGMVDVGNFAISGSTLAHGSSNSLDGNPTSSANKTIPNQVQKLINNVSSYDTPDLILIMAGVNDSTDVTISYVEEEFTKSIDECDISNFSGAMRWAYEKLATTYPNALIVFVTPYQVKRNNYKLKEKIQVIVESCERLSVDCINSYSNSGICDIFETSGANGKYLADGLHHNADGGVKFAKFIHNELAKLVYKLY